MLSPTALCAQNLFLLFTKSRKITSSPYKSNLRRNQSKISKLLSNQKLSQEMVSKSKLRCYNAENEVTAPNLSLEIIPSSSSSSPLPVSPSPSKPPYEILPIRDLLLHSPSPLCRSRTRLAEKLDNNIVDDGFEQQGAKKRSKSKNYATMLLGHASPRFAEKLGNNFADEGVEQQGAKKRSKSKNYATMLLGHASPRNNRRSRKRIEQDVKEDKDFGVGEDLVIRARKKRQSGSRSKKDKLSSVPSTPSPKGKNEEGCNLDRIKHVISELIMWKDVAKSSLWFGFGSICFLSSCFTSGIKFSFCSVISQLGLLFLVLSFFSNSVRPRDGSGNRTEFRLKEEDILRVGRLILPAANLVISRTKELFSGEPGMTLKVVPFLLVGAEFGHLITLWRLCVLGFFISFTWPKLYSCYSVQISKQVKYISSGVLERWESCSHKKIVAASVFTAFWNLTSIRTRIFAAFLSLVLIRYYRQNSDAKVDEEEHQQASIVVKSDDCRQNLEANVEEVGDKETEKMKQAIIVVNNSEPLKPLLKAANQENMLKPSRGAGFEGAYMDQYEITGCPDGVMMIKEWKDIPMEILFTILSLVNDDRVVIVAAGVCSDWKVSISWGLKNLNLSWCKKNMNNLVLSLVPKFHNLKVLDLQQATPTPHLQDDAIEMISAHCVDLQELDIGKSLMLTDASLYALAKGCPNLSSLNINGCKSMTENAVAYLASFWKHLTFLNLGGCIQAASDTSLKAIASNCNNLQSINLRWCENVSDEGVKSLANGCPNLRAIDLCGCIHLTDESVISLANNCTYLRWLSLYYCMNITDKSMYGLAQSQLIQKGKGLIHLDISLCTALNPEAVQVVCDSFPALHTCPGRHSLVITGCPRLSSAHCACGFALS